ncbi:MAG: hypothetical protein HQL53_02805 [Magnetococcales bacterium]|nr:hypothetical protein [Magnetococcales bacterium]
MRDKKTPAEKGVCIHCGASMKKWSTPDISFSDGLGFGAEALLVCFNDACPLYVNGWNSMFDRYGRVGSMRYWQHPADNDDGALPVAHKDAMRGDIIED